MVIIKNNIKTYHSYSYIVEKNYYLFEINWIGILIEYTSIYAFDIK